MPVMLGTGESMLERCVSLMVASVLVGCSGGNPSTVTSTKDYWREGASVHVRGPWEAIEPSADVDEVIDQLCPAIMVQPHARGRDYGQEYCGAIYSLGDGRYYASNPSPIGEPVPVGPAKRKSCIPPRRVVDERGRTVVLADYHSHPWAPSPMSPADRIARTQIWSIRIQFDRDCTVMKLVPYLDSNRPGEVFVRRGAQWILVGIIRPEDKGNGIVTAVEAD